MQKTKPKETKLGDGKLYVDTELGQLVAYLSTDPEHPGIYIDLKQENSDYMASVAMVEFTSDDCDASGSMLPPSIVCRVWGDALKEDYTDAIICQNMDEYFKSEYSKNENG